MTAAVLPRARAYATAAWVVAWVVAATAPAAAKLTPPKLEGFVVDTSGTLGAAAKSSIERELSAFQASTGYSIVVLVTKSLDGDSIEDAAYSVFNAWKVGERGKDTGVLLLVAPAERKIRIETGKGAGGAITDLQANDIIREMAPLMAQSQVDVAVQVAITRLESLIRTDIGSAVQPAPSTTKRSSTGRVIAYVIFALVVVLGIVLAIRRARRKAARGDVQGAVGTARGAVTAFEVVAGVLKIIGSVAGRGGGSKSNRRSGGRGGSSGGGGSSGNY